MFGIDLSLLSMKVQKEEILKQHIKTTGVSLFVLNSDGILKPCDGGDHNKLSIQILCELRDFNPSNAYYISFTIYL